MQFRDTITVDKIEVHPIRASGGVSPKMALGTMPTRPALLVKIIDTSGCFGWGEVWANFPPRANIHKAHIIEDVVAEHVAGFKFSDPREVQSALRAKLSTYFLHIGQTEVFEHILAGIDTALWDLAKRHSGLSFREFAGTSHSSARSYATSINTEDLDHLIPKHADLGQTYFKLKIGFAAHGQADILGRADALCPVDGHLMVDSNQSWSLEQAKTSLQALEDYALYFAEEPIRADAPKSDWEALARATTIPLAGGENIYGVAEFLSMVDAGLRVLQPDVAKWGGVSGALDLAEAVPNDVLIWPHFMGTAVGQMAALSISAAIGETSCCEVDVNENELRKDLCGDIFAIKDGRVALPTAPGLVVAPDANVLATFSDMEG